MPLSRKLIAKGGTRVDVKRPENTVEETVVPLLEETLHVRKRQVETGRVRISVGTTREERVVRETLRSGHAKIEHVAIGRELAEGEAVPTVRRDADGTLIVPILEEILVIERRLVLREELHLRISNAEETVEETVTLRRQQAVVERLPQAPSDGADHSNELPSSGGSTINTTVHET